MSARVLIVEDQDSIRFAIQDYFRSLGYEVDEAADLVQAGDRLADGPYSLVITDMRLGRGPNRDGLAVVSAARDRCPSARVVVLTAYGSPAAELEALHRGADRFLHKDRPLAEVAGIVADLLEG